MRDVLNVSREALVAAMLESLRRARDFDARFQRGGITKITDRNFLPANGAGLSSCVASACDAMSARKRCRAISSDA
jgi:hypothetical protein